MGGNPGDPGCEGDPFEDFPCNRVVSRTSFFAYRLIKTIAPLTLNF